MRTTNSSRILALSTLIVLGFAATNAVAADGTFETSLSVPEGTTLDVKTGSGSIRVATGNGRDVTIVGKILVNRRSFWRKTPDAAEIVAAVQEDPPVRLAGNTLEVGRFDDKTIGKNVSISYEIVVPADTAVVAVTGSGSVRISDIEATADAHSGSGSVTLTNIGASAKARTGSGRIRAENIAGAFSGRSGSGSIFLSQTAPGDVEVSTGSGRSELHGVVGALDASAGSGGIEVEGRQTGDWRLNTGSGTIRIDLPDDAGFEVDAYSNSGRIVVEHPLTIEGRIDKKHVEGKVRGGGPMLKIDTGSGGIRID